MPRILLIVFLLGGCAPFVPVTNVDEVDPDVLEQSYRVRVFTLDQASDYPGIDKVLGPVTAYSCKHWMWDAPASKGDALIQLRLNAAEKAADGVIDVTFDSRGTDTYGTNCWESVQASGMAVTFRAQE